MAAPVSREKGRLRASLSSALPAVAVSFSDDLSEGEITEICSHGVDVVEARVDWFASVEPESVLARLQPFSKLATIATLRCAAEGGEWRGSEEDRLSLFRALAPEVDAVDIELSSESILASVVEAARQCGTEVIVSVHDFASTPEAAWFDDIDTRARSAGADYVKVAVTPRSFDDLRRLAAFTLKRADAGVIALGMGPFGALSRVLLPALGSRLVFARPATGRGGVDRSVPGQLDLDETLELLRRLYPAPFQ